MLGEEIFRIDLLRLYGMVGEIADRSQNDYDPHITDLSDWLTENEITRANDLEKIPPSGVKSFMISYLSGYEYKNIVTYFPRFDQVFHLPDPHMIEITDLLLATTILFDLIGMQEERKEEYGNNVSGKIDRVKATQIVILGNKKCWLTLDSMTFPLIKAMTHIASVLDLKLDRAKKRRSTKTENGALDPAMRI